MDINRLLKETDSPGEITSLLYKYSKKQNSKFSLQYICNQCGISSKGYLSEMMKENRKLKVDYARPLAKLFNLNRTQTHIYSLLIQMINTVHPEELKAIHRKIKTARKNLDLQSLKIKSGDYNPLIFSKVYSSFGLFSSPATIKEISEKISELQSEVKKALLALEDQGFAIFKNKKWMINKEHSQQVRFTESDMQNFHKSLIKSALQKSSHAVDKHFDLNEQSFFESSVISVDFKNYKELLKRIKQTIDEFETEMETDKADKLVHFNVQIYPD